MASAAVATVTRWGFGGLGLRRIWLRHGLADAASCAVAGRCGYPVEEAGPDTETHARLATDPEPSGG